MWKAAITGFLLLTMAGSTAVMAEGAANRGYRLQSQGGVSPEMESGIARFKSALQLNAHQERHWPRVEAALRAMDRDKESDTGDRGMLRRIGHRAADIVISAANIQRLVSAARPLMKTLDDDQRSKALTLARAMGLGSVAAHFN
jgi:hypothetical protein